MREAARDFVLYFDLCGESIYATDFLFFFFFLMGICQTIIFGRRDNREAFYFSMYITDKKKKHITAICFCVSDTESWFGVKFTRLQIFISFIFRKRE